MYIESIIFKRDEESAWEPGYYVGDTDNSINSVILDVNYEVVIENSNGCNIYDYRKDMRRYVCISIPETIIGANDV